MKKFYMNLNVKKISIYKSICSIYKISENKIKLFLKCYH